MHTSRTTRLYRSTSLLAAVFALGLGTSACEVNYSSTNPPPSSAAKPATPKPQVSRPAAKPATNSARPKPAPKNVYEADGLRFTINPKLRKSGGGLGIDVSIQVEASDRQAHVIYGLSKGIAFGGIRFGSEGGGLPLGEGGTVTRYGRVKPGSPLTIGRSFPGEPAPGGGWVPLRKGDNLVLSLKTWHTIGETPQGEPKELGIGAITVSVDDAGKATMAVELPKE